MTKEELYEKGLVIGTPNGNYKFVKLSYLDEFFESNVVTPKGEVRHRFADELHFLAENANSVHECNIDLKPRGIGKVTLAFNVKLDPHPLEWQWQLFGKDNGVCRGLMGAGEFMTEDEAMAHYLRLINTNVYELERIERTKRTRK